jgi:D-3-phosphoglycerate dehydrogenase
VLRRADVVSLHTNLTSETREFVNRNTIALMKDNAILVNTGRGGLVNEQDVAEACRSGKLKGYGADVLETEPMKVPHVFQGVDNIIVTPHVGSRTNESVVRQGLRAANNIVNYLCGGTDYLQANRF